MIPVPVGFFKKQAEDAAPFSPSDLCNVGWFDPDEYVLTSLEVSEWTNQYGSGEDLTDAGVSAQRPTPLTDGIDTGKNGLVFNSAPFLYLSTTYPEIDFDRNSEFSFGFWIKTSKQDNFGIVGNFTSMATAADPRGGAGIYSLADGTLVGGFRASNSRGRMISTNAVNVFDDNPHFVMLTYGGGDLVSNFKFFIDGSLVGSSVYINNGNTYSSSSSILTVGAALADGTNKLDATLGHIYVFSCELRAENVTSLYNYY